MLKFVLVVVDEWMLVSCAVDQETYQNSHKANRNEKQARSFVALTEGGDFCFGLDD